MDRCWLQSSSFAKGTDGLSAITCQHHSVLYLVEVFLQHSEEVIDAIDVLFVMSIPEELFLLLCKVVISTMNGEIYLVGIVCELPPPLAHLLTPPTLDTFLLQG